jgi:CRISPR-associated endonuclease Csn1
MAGKTTRRNLGTEFGQTWGISRVRVLKRESTFIRIENAQGKAYKALIPGENHCVEIFRKADGRWAGERISVFDANSRQHEPRWRTDHPGASLVMQIFKGDLLKLEHDGQQRIMVVKSLEPNQNRLWMVEQYESGNFAARKKDRDDSFDWLIANYERLRALGARKVGVNPFGRVHDPGPPA